MQINIAIIEDEPCFVEQLCALLQQWERENGSLINMKKYPSADQFFLNWNEADVFDVVFIDIMLPGSMDGVAIAKEIRKHNEDVPLVFVTSVTEKMPEGYRVSALQYLLKPASYADLQVCMNKVVKRMQNREQSYYHFQKGKNTMVRIPYNDIMYFVSALQYTDIHTHSGVERQLERLKNIEALLPAQFVRCHRSYIVNMRSVYSITPMWITTVSKEMIPISKTFFDSVKEKFIQYVDKEVL